MTEKTTQTANRLSAMKRCVAHVMETPHMFPASTETCGPSQKLHERVDADMARHYTCDSCRFTFECAEDAESCPDCGKLNIRAATREEIADYRRNREEWAVEDYRGC